MNRLTKYACMLAAIAGMTACSGGQKVQGDYGVIPLPYEVNAQSGAPFVLKSSTPIVYDEGNAELERVAHFLAGYIKDATGHEPKVKAGNSAEGIRLTIATDIENPEGYRLTVNENGIEIAGGAPAGTFYGVQTLRKSIPANAKDMQVELPAVTISSPPTR